MMRILLLLALVACSTNDADTYAHFLKPSALCFNVAKGSRIWGDVVICQINDLEHPPMVDWLCTSEPYACRPLGPTIHVELKDPP